MNTPENLKYSAKHQWFSVDNGAIGITDYAQKKLGTIVYIELPEVGQKVSADDVCGTIESTKAASDLFSPINGTITEINDQLMDEPETVNSDPYGAGWFFKVDGQTVSGAETLLDAAAYTNLTK